MTIKIIADMRSMKKCVIMVLSAMLLLACGNKSQEVKPMADDKQQERGLTPSPSPKGEGNDSKGEGNDNKGEGNYKEPSRSASSSSYPSSYYSDEDEDYDNMRGFDPASEDDMEDNGMSSYMENYDEEGWE